MKYKKHTADCKMQSAVCFTKMKNIILKEKKYTMYSFIRIIHKKTNKDTFKADGACGKIYSEKQRFP